MDLWIQRLPCDIDEKHPKTIKVNIIKTYKNNIYR